jgi:Acetyltransferase (GNAT) family
VKQDNGSYIDRSTFIGAYHDGELVGFVKMVTVGTTASIMQILSKIAHQDRRCANALIAKAVELCAANGLSHLIYCKYTYHRGHSDSLTEFKRRNGFQEARLPRYYVPLTQRGRIALRLNLQEGIRDVLPRRVLVGLLAARAKYYEQSRRLATGRV